MERAVTADLAGAIWKVLAHEGDTVQENDTLLVMESMKMEIPVLAPEAGRVARIWVQEGAVVQEGDLLITLDVPA